MHNAAGGDASLQSECRQDIRDRIVSDLGLLMEQIDETMRLIETAIAEEASHGHQEAAAGIVVLDDVTPRYAKANTALRACRAELGAALDVVQDMHASRPPSGGSWNPLRQAFRV